MPSQRPEPIRKAQKVTVKVENLPPVIVFWDDAQLHTDFDDLPTAAEEQKYGLAANQTIGFLLSRGKRITKLVIDLDPATNTARWLYTIPTKLVTSITYLTREPQNGPNLTREPRHGADDLAQSTE